MLENFVVVGNEERLSRDMIRAFVVTWAPSFGPFDFDESAFHILNGRGWMMAHGGELGTLAFTLPIYDASFIMECNVRLGREQGCFGFLICFHNSICTIPLLVLLLEARCGAGGDGWMP